MYFQLIQKIVPFVLTFVVSVAIVTLVQSWFDVEVSPSPVQPQAYSGESGSGNGPGFGTTGPRSDAPPALDKNTVPYKIISKPKPAYTDEARANNFQGSVRLKVTLLASGNVGSVTPITRAPYGLTEMAIAAARQIKFEPKKVNGVPQSISVTVEYSFVIY